MTAGVLGEGRVPGVVTFVRWLCLCAAAAFTILFLVPPTTPASSGLAVTTTAGVLVGLLDLAAVRALFLGAWVRRGQVTVRDWFRTTVIPASAVRAVSTAAYEGFLVRGSRSWALQIVTLAVDGRPPVRIHASVAFWPSAMRKRDRCRVALGLATAHPLGDHAKRP